MGPVDNPDEEVDIKQVGNEWQARFDSCPWVVGKGQSPWDAVVDLANQLEE